jgi:hypothetical protein
MLDNFDHIKAYWWCRWGLGKKAIGVETSEICISVS